MVVPAYCCSRAGRVFRLLRSSHALDAERVRYSLRAVPIRFDQADQGVERTKDLDTALLRDKMRHRQAVPTPEQTFEQLWEQLRLDLDVP